MMKRSMSLRHVVMKDGEMIGLPHLWILVRRVIAVLRSTDKDCKIVRSKLWWHDLTG